MVTIQIIQYTYKRQSGLLRTATPDYFGLLWTTLDGYAGHRGSQYPPQGPAWPGWPLGKLATKLTSWLPCAGSVYLYDCRIRAGFPYINGGALPYVPHTLTRYGLFEQ